uniref:TSA: Wollemia nobilis Ref_Wollemi_Transcript_5020_1293 transcribed RNA sequence n=1 Tax=Wollemia nobilis TaxID=56998 RepID=A0A0C9QVW6_9CONI
MAQKLALFFMACALAAAQARAWKASCEDPYYGSCYGIAHACPPGCPRTCEVDCKLCKPICACDKPGAVCQDPRFIGGDGIMFYFHGKKDRDFCLVSDSNLHINGHFIGKTKTRGLRRDFTWVQSIGVQFDSHQLYVGANKVAAWDDGVDQLKIQLDGQEVVPPPGKGAVASSGEVTVTRVQNANAVSIRVGERFAVTARVVPITEEESKVHGYGITADDCFAHLELNFKFYELSPRVTGVLGQTYAAGFRSPVKVGVAMPIMGGEDKFAVSHLFATDCKVARFGQGVGEALGVEFPAVSCASGSAAGHGIVCRR